MKVAKWGNSLAVRLPRGLVEDLALKDGDEIELTSNGERSFEVSRDRARDDALARISAARWPLPAGYTFDREETHERAGSGRATDEP